MKSSIGKAAQLEISVLGEMPLCIPSGKLDLINAVAEQGAFLVPFKAEIVNIITRVRTQNDAQAVVSIGKQGSAAYFGTVTVPNASPAGTIIPYTAGTSLEVAANDVIVFSADGGATAAGNCDVLVVLRPDPA